MILKTYRAFEAVCSTLKAVCGFEKDNEAAQIARDLFKEVKRPDAEYNDVEQYCAALYYYNEYVEDLAKASCEDKKETDYIMNEFAKLELLREPLEKAGVPEWRIRCYCYKILLKDRVEMRFNLDRQLRKLRKSN